MKEAEISSSTYLTSQSPIAENLIHYRNIFASPESFIIRRVDYSKMKVFDEKFRKESERLKSLQKLVTRNKDLLPLMAKTGLYFKENPPLPDQVSCIYCQGIFSNWKKNDLPVKRHKFSYPTCPYVIYLNVGNEPLKYDTYKSPNEDTDVIKPRMKINFAILIQDNEIAEEFLDQVNKLDVDFREQTFHGYPKLISFALQGLYVVNKESIAILKCCSCLKEMLILSGIENMDNNAMHKNNCEYGNIDQVIEREIVESSDLSKDFCEVEYSITNEEIDARMETRSTSQLLKGGVEREVLRSIIAFRLKSKGRDFDSQFELLQELKNDVKKFDRKQTLNEQNFVLTEFSCVVCLDKTVEVIFLPCGHLKTCVSCSNLMAACPVCRIQIEKRVKKFRFNCNI